MSTFRKETAVLVKRLLRGDFEDIADFDSAVQKIVEKRRTKFVRGSEAEQVYLNGRY